MTTYNYSHILKISVPLVLGFLIQVLVGMTDTAFLERVGEIELGASAIAGILCSIVYFAAIRIIVGILQLELIWCWLSEFGYYIVLLAASYCYMKKKKQFSKNV